jgi:outer membrane lipoprotein-sorting protein
LERWIDRENGRVRFSTVRVSCTPEKVEIDRMETVSDGQYRMILNHTDKSAILYELSDYQRMLQIHYSLKDMFNGLFGNIETFDKFERTGQENAGGVAYEIWEAEVTDQTGARDRYKYWLSPLTGQSGRFQCWYKNAGEQWRLGHDFYKIERNVDIPEGVFELVVPEGYEAKNTRETAIPLELDEEGGIGNCGLMLDPHISFALSDGSVILAWCSVDRESAIPQQKLFEGLEFGGPLPKLPAEIYGLKPRGWTGEIVYIGRHLTHTQKGEKFVEWSLYIPTGVPPVHSQILDYEAVCRYNLESQEDGVLEGTVNQNVPRLPGAGLPPSARNQMLRDTGLWITVNQGIPIKSSEDFDKWVLGAMVELSDDRSVPEPMTYESVLELADEIRQSITD